MTQQLRKASTVLLVDDIESSIGFVQSALEGAGYKVVIATTGEKALQRAKLVLPDLILLDVLLPGIDGYETCKKLKAINEIRNIPVIFLSALTETFDKVKGFGLGAVDYLIKPIPPEELLARVGTHITISNLDKELRLANRNLEVRVAERTAELETVNTALRQEITDHKKAQKELVLLSFALNHVGESAFLVGKDARFQYVNDEGCKKLGYLRDEFPGMFVSDIDPGFPLERWISHWSELKIKGSLTFETYHKKKDGTNFPVEVNANYFEYDEEEYNLALARDITERKKAGEALRLSEERYRLLHENAGVGIGYYTPEGIVISFNNLAAKYMNGKPDDFIGKSIFELFPETEAEFYSNRIKISVQSEFNTAYEDCLNLPSGEKWLLSIFSRICDSQKKVIGVQIISQDITTKKIAEKELREQMKEIERFNQLMIGREEKMIELKNEINTLLQKEGKPMKYDVPKSQK